MQSLSLFEGSLNFVAGWGWFFLWAGFILSVVYAFDEFKETCDEIKAATGRKKITARLKLGLLCSLPIVTLIGAVGSQWSSEVSDRKIRILELGHKDATNRLVQATAKVNELEAKLQPRTITPEQYTTFIASLQGAPKARFGFCVVIHLANCRI